jgi:HEAT repeat protein
MSAAAEIKSLVSRLPDPDKNGTYANLDQAKVAQIEQAGAQLEQGGREAVLELIGLLAAPGQVDDFKARFALHVLAVRVTQPGHERARAEFAQAVASRLGGDRPKAVQAYLIEQLQLTGSRAVVETLGKALLDPELCDQAARALAAIRDGAAEALLRAWPQVSGPSRRSILAKLGMLRAKSAAAAFRQGLADADPEIRVAAAWGLARIADAAAGPSLLKCADAATGWERINTTDACMALAEGLAAAGQKDAAAAIYQHLAKSRTADAERHIRAAAEKGLAALAQK